MTGSRADRRLAVFCLGAGIVLLFAAIGQLLVEQRMTSGVSYSLLAALALFICYGVLSPTAVLDLVRSRQARFGSLSVVVTAAVIGVLVMANVIASRSTLSADLTRGHLYTLSPKSQTVVRQLDSDLLITGFFRPGTEQAARDDAEALLSQYERESPHVKVQFVNPDTNLEEAQRLGVRINGSFALRYKNRQPIVLNLGSQTESDFTSAILKLEASHTPVVCWAAGEGERDLKETKDFGYSEAAAQLQADNFQLKDVILQQLTQVPADCEVLAVVGLQNRLGDRAIKAIQDYVSGGGRLLLAVDPWLDAPVLSTANALIKPSGAAYDGGLVVEPDPAHHSRDDVASPAVFEYGDSPITNQLANKLTFFPISTAIGGQVSSSWSAVQVAQTTKDAYEAMTVRDPKDLGRRSGDRGGPLTLMETLESGGAPKKARIVLVGTTAFAENRALPPNASDYNLQLLLGSFDWLAGNDQLIALPPKPTSSTPLFLTDQDLNVNFLVTMLLLPGLVVAAGVTVWLRRRHSYAPPA